MYIGNLANMLVDNCLTGDFELKSVVLQGSKLGPILFLIYINDLLLSLQQSKLGATIGDITISCLGFADDIVLASESPESLQMLINKCESWALENRMVFNTNKCKVMIFNRPSSNLHFTMYNEELSIVNNYKYLGIEISNKNPTNLYIEHFS